MEDENLGLLLDTGYSKPISTVTLVDRNKISDVLKKYHCLIKVKAEIDQFIEGLRSLNIEHYIQSYSELMKVLFVDVEAQRSISAGTVLLNFCRFAFFP